MRLNKTAKILIATGTTLLTSALFFGRKAKAASLKEYSIPAQATTGPNAGIITNHDTVYDYKLENGRWYTRRKGTVNWTDMQSALSPQAYQLAVSRLNEYRGR
jgi:hypothetical protein